MSRAEYDEWRDPHTWQPSGDTALVIQDDLTPASWIGPRLRADSFEVRMTVPEGFDAYARIFFPLDVRRIAEDGHVWEGHLTWKELARRNGRIAHPLMEKATIQQAVGEETTCHRSLAPEQLEALQPILARHTRSPFAWFLLWEGFGDLDERAFPGDRPRVNHPMRNHFLLRGPLDSYGSLPHDPSYWWPNDRAWCLCTDIDFDWGYVAGSSALIDEIVAVPTIDALETQPQHPAHSGMDVINVPDGGVPRP